MSFRSTALLITILLAVANIYSISYNIDTNDGKTVILQTIFNFGFSAEAVSDGIGVTDYQSTYFKTAFHAADFGIGIDLKLRFRLFSGAFEFRTLDWYIPDNPLETAFIYIDKIDYIVYGNSNGFIHLLVGDIPYTTFGTGFITSNLHNLSFKPTSKELGLYFRFNGFNLNLPSNNIVPFSTTFIVTDLLDPDIFGFDIFFDPFDFFAHLKNDFSLNIGLTSNIDLNADEPNRLNSAPSDTMINHRNIYQNNSAQFTTTLLFSSLYLNFTYKHAHFVLNIADEFAIASDIPNTFGVGNNIEANIKFINIPDSGHLLGINLGFIYYGPNFSLNPYGSNFEVNRRKTLDQVQNGINHNFILTGGISLYGLNDKLEFKLNGLFLLSEQFALKLYSHFLLKDGLVPGLNLSVIYETGLNVFNINGDNGGNFIKTITEGFRFAVRVDYHIFNAKIGLLLGIQAPGSLQPVYLDSENFNLNLTEYSDDLQKFISLETSIVF